MKASLHFLVCLFWGYSAFASPDSTLRDDELAAIKFEQKLGAQLSSDLLFYDDTGRAIRLGDCFRGKPSVLILGYYGCPMLCTLVLNGAIQSFQDLKWTAGRDFNVIFVSIDPAETPRLAAEKKRTYLHSFSRGDADGWHFLTGGAANIKSLADEVGFRFAYDSASHQFAHPSGFMVLSPNGRISQYFMGVTYSASQVNSALRGAADGKTSSLADQFALLCFHHAPLTGKYGQIILTSVRIAAVLMVTALATLLLLPRGWGRGGRK